MSVCGGIVGWTKASKLPLRGLLPGADRAGWPTAVAAAAAGRLAFLAGVIGGSGGPETAPVTVTAPAARRLRRAAGISE